MLSKYLSIYYCGIIGSTTYMFYRDVYYNYYLNKGNNFTKPTGFFNIGTIIGVATGYYFHKLLNDKC